MRGFTTVRCIATRKWNDYLGLSEVIRQRLVYIGIILSIGMPTMAEPLDVPKNEEGELKCRVTSYCGAHCLYTIMRLYNEECDIRDLVTPKYISSGGGISLADLYRAATDHGMYASPAKNLSVHELKQSRWPIILYVKGDDTSKYNHFLLYLGTRDGKAMIFDPPNPGRLIPFQDLLWRWGGVGLIISDRPIDLSVIAISARWRYIKYVLIVLFTIVCLHLCNRYTRQTATWSRYIPLNRPLSLSLIQGALFVISAIVLGLLCYSVGDHGFRRSPEGIKRVQAAHQAIFIPKISKRRAKALLNKEEVLFVDARFSSDYNYGFIEGAINIPVDANDTQRRRELERMGPETPIVVYCQSSRCKFAEKIATAIALDGYTNVTVYRGGVARMGESRRLRRIVSIWI